MRLNGMASESGTAHMLVVVLVAVIALAVLIAVGMILDGRSQERPIRTRLSRLRSRRRPPS